MRAPLCVSGIRRLRGTDDVYHVGLLATSAYPALAQAELVLKRCLSVSKGVSSSENLYPHIASPGLGSRHPTLAGGIRHVRGMSGHLRQHLRHVLEGVS